MLPTYDDNIQVMAMLRGREIFHETADQETADGYRMTGLEEMKGMIPAQDPRAGTKGCPGSLCGFNRHDHFAYRGRQCDYDMSCSFDVYRILLLTERQKDPGRGSDTLERGNRFQEYSLRRWRRIMFRVLVVDDEPAVLEYLCGIIEEKCPELTVAATAADGREGLERFRECIPDLIISDVKMPVMDGVDMIRAVKELGEEVPVLLLSGYQEFAYVKTALTYGAADYILKPVTTKRFMEAVEPALGLLRQKAHEQRGKLARSLIMGEKGNEEKLCRYFPEPAYYAALIRENGLPRRFADARQMETVLEKERAVFIYERDEREALYLCPSGAVDREEFFGFIEKERDRKKESHNFITVVMEAEAVDRERLSDAVSGLYEELNRRLSMGVTQTIVTGWRQTGERGGRTAREADSVNEIYGAEMIKGMDRYLERRDCGKIFEELHKLICKAETVRCPQLKLERLVRQFGAQVQHYFNSSQDVFEEEVMLEDAFYEAGTSQELYESLKTMLTRYWRRDKETVKLDSPEFIQEIRDFVQDNLSQDLTVATLCREFNLSQSYLNQIFRKHGMESFSIYLRSARINRAKEIMDRNPQMFIKDVAMMVGYKDQFYFSRIFRAVTGMSPSEYPGRK